MLHQAWNSRSHACCVNITGLFLHGQVVQYKKTINYSPSRRMPASYDYCLNMHNAFTLRCMNVCMVDTEPQRRRPG